MAIGYLAKNAVTGRWWDGKEFNAAPMNQARAKTLTAGEKAVLNHTYDNVKFLAFEMEPTAEERQASETIFIKMFGGGRPNMEDEKTASLGRQEETEKPAGQDRPNRLAGL